MKLFNYSLIAVVAALVVSFAATAFSSTEASPVAEIIVDKDGTIVKMIRISIDTTTNAHPLAHGATLVIFKKPEANMYGDIPVAKVIRQSIYDCVEPYYATIDLSLYDVNEKLLITLEDNSGPKIVTENSLAWYEREFMCRDIKISCISRNCI
jgi:hypothetical protein